jgi:hypothetical protein
MDEIMKKLKVANCSIAEYLAWVARNEARATLKNLRRDAGLDPGQELDPGTFDEEDVANVMKVIAEAAATQRRLNTARAATRRAAAAIGEEMKP